LFIPENLKQLKKQNIKEIKAREMYTRSLYWLTLNPRATSSPHKLQGFYCATKTYYNTNHQKSDLEPFKKHTPFGTSHSNFALTLNYRNTVIKKEENRIHLGITKLKDQKYTPMLFHTLENPKLEVNLENLKFNLHYDSSKLFLSHSRSV